MALSKVNLGRIAEDGAVTTAKITDGTLVNADFNACAAITSTKADIAQSTELTNAIFNTALLGFKMAVNDSLTVFNLVDGVVDEFHDESGTDEAEGSNDLYNTCDFYLNSTSPTGSAIPISAGFSTTARTESDTSTSASTPQYGLGEGGTFTVPTGLSSANIQVWGAGGGGAGPSPGEGGGGGYAEGTLAVTASQVLHVFAGEGARAGNIDCGPTDNAFLNGGGTSYSGQPQNPSGGGGGGLAGVFSVDLVPLSSPQYSAPTAYVVAGSGGGGADDGGREGNHPPEGWDGGAGGGLIGDAGGLTTEQVNGVGTVASGQIVGSDSQLGAGGGDQEQGGQAASYGYPGSLFTGGLGLRSTGGTPHHLGGGGAGYYGGGGGVGDDAGGGTAASGGGGSSFYGHPQITSGSTEEGAEKAGGGTTQPGYVSSTNEGGCGPSTTAGEDGYVLITGSVAASATSTAIVSNAFTAGSAPSTSRIVVFQENIDTPTLNTDIIASVSRDGGSNFSTVTLVDDGYVTGSSGQRILTGLVDISGQPSGTSMRWKLALANNASKIHGVSLAWA